MQQSGLKTFDCVATTICTPPQLQKSPEWKTLPSYTVRHLTSAVLRPARVSVCAGRIDASKGKRQP